MPDTATTPSYLMLAHPCAENQDCAFTWTLTARLGHAIARAEAYFGPRDPDMIPLGVEFTSGPNPMVWYPRFDNNTRFVIVQITDEAAGDEAQALFQLSHEVIHLITRPDLDNGSTVLEEGLATWFSLIYTRENGHDLGRRYINVASYRQAYDLIKLVEKMDSDFALKLGDLARAVHGFSRITHKDLLRVFPEMSSDLARQLTERFH